MPGPEEIVQNHYLSLSIESHDIDDLMGLYRLESTVVRRIDGEITRFEDLHSIQSYFENLDYYEISYGAVYSQSWDQGFLFTVLGSLRSRSFANKRRFAQSFFVAPDFNYDTYFIHSDIFFFIGDETGIATSSSDGLVDGHGIGHHSPSSVGENESVTMETDDTHSDSSGDSFYSGNFQNTLEVRRQPHKDDKSFDKPIISLDSSTLLFDDEAVDAGLYSFRTFWNALESINGIPSTEPVKAVYNTAVEEPVVSTENTTFASYEEPQKQKNGDILKSIPKALQIPSAATQSSGRPAFDKRNQPALTESDKSHCIKDSPDQVEDQQEKNLVSVIEVLPIEAVDVAPVEKSVVFAANPTTVASTEEPPEPTDPLSESAEEAINS